MEKSLIFKSFQHYFRHLPWQMKSTLIMKFSCSEMPCNAEFCVGLSAFYGIVFFLFITTLFAKYFKMVQFNATCSSQIVVSSEGSDYGWRGALFNDRGGEICIRCLQSCSARSSCSRRCRPPPPPRPRAHSRLHRTPHPGRNKYTFLC